MLKIIQSTIVLSHSCEKFSRTFFDFCFMKHKRLQAKILHQNTHVFPQSLKNVETIFANKKKATISGFCSYFSIFSVSFPTRQNNLSLRRFSFLRATKARRKFWNSKPTKRLMIARKWVLQDFLQLQLHWLLIQHAGQHSIALRRQIIIVIGFKFPSTVCAVSKRQHWKSNRCKRKIELHVQRLADG